MKGSSLSMKIASRASMLAPWIVTLWLAAMASWYIKTAITALQHPHTPGDDIKLVTAWLILVAAVVLSHVLIRRRIVTHVWTLFLTAVGLIMVILSRQSGAILITLWLLILAWTCGDWLLRRMGAELSEVRLEWVCLACTTGLVLLSIAGLALLLAHRMSARWTWMLLLGITLIQWRSFLGLFERMGSKAMSRSVAPVDDPLPEQPILLVLLGLVGLFNLAWALAPEIMYDGIWYHLAAPKVYLAEHRLINLPYGYNAHLVETIFTVALALHGQIVAKLLVLAMSGVAAFGVYALGSRLFSPRVGLWSAALFYSTPMISWLSGTTYIDLVVALFLVATVLAFLRWRETRQIAWLMVTGFLAGAALGAKLNALFGLPVIAFFLIMDLLRTPQLSAGSKVKALAGCALATTLVAAPYFVITYLFTGSPIFPILNGLFTAGSFSPSANFDAASVAEFSLGYSPLVFLKLPFLLTFQSQRFGQALPAGALGLSLALLPLGLLLMARRQVAVILLLICAVFLALLGYTMPLGRYYIPILPVVVVLGIASVIDFPPIMWLKRLNLACLGATLVAQVALIPLMFWNIPERVPLGLVLGAESQDDFLARSLPAYRAVQYVNQNCPPTKRVLGVGMNNMHFYLKNQLSTAHEMAPYPTDATTPEIAARLARDGFAFLVVDKQSEAFTRPLPYLRESFLTQYANLEYVGNDTYVYRLQESAAVPPVETNR